MLKLLSRNTAAKTGSTRYYTGIPCIRGHDSVRVTSTGACVECKKERRSTKENVSYMRDYNKRVRVVLKEALAQKVK